MGAGRGEPGGYSSAVSGLNVKLQGRTRRLPGNRGAEPACTVRRDRLGLPGGPIDRPEEARAGDTIRVRGDNRDRHRLTSSRNGR